MVTVKTCCCNGAGTCGRSGSTFAKMAFYDCARHRDYMSVTAVLDTTHHSRLPCTTPDDAILEVKDNMRGWPQTKAGTNIRGQKNSRRNKWIAFDGSIPHAVFPFEGTRLSIVYFTRSKYLYRKDEYRAQFEAAGFAVPGPEWELRAGVNHKRLR